MLTSTRTTLLAGMTLITLLVGFAFWLLGSRSHDDAALEARHFIANAYRQTDAAVTQRDSRISSSFMRPNYQITYKGKTTLKPELIQRLNVIYLIAKSIRTKTMIQKFAFLGTKAIVEAQEITEITFLSKRTHRLKKVKTDGVFQEIWMKENAQWLKQKSVILHRKMTLDGAPVEKVVVD